MTQELHNQIQSLEEWLEVNLTQLQYWKHFLVLRCFFFKENEKNSIFNFYKQIKTIIQIYIQMQQNLFLQKTQYLLVCSEAVIATPRGLNCLLNCSSVSLMMNYKEKRLTIIKRK